VVTVFTIGHSTRTADEFVALLRAHGVRHVVDVRRFPASRRHPQFSSEQLAGTLHVAGMDYRHAEALGGRRAARQDSRNTAWRNAAFRGYADHMASPEFRVALDRLVTEAGSAPTAILCAEAVHWRCHRNLLSDALVARGLEVRHILSPERAEAHTRNPAAVVRPDGVIEYPAGGQLGLLD
jgi:uncharacterized protein (DUF488 family)